VPLRGEKGAVETPDIVGDRGIGRGLARDDAVALPEDSLGIGRVLLDERHQRLGSRHELREAAPGMRFNPILCLTLSTDDMAADYFTISRSNKQPLSAIKGSVVLER
jgi:hypothetical protein